MDQQRPRIVVGMACSPGSHAALLRPRSGYETYPKTEPEQGGTFVVIEAHITTDGQSILDLMTCNCPIDAKLVDDRDRNFDPLDELYKLKATQVQSSLGQRDPFGRGDTGEPAGDAPVQPCPSCMLNRMDTGIAQMCHAPVFESRSDTRSSF